MKSWFQQCVQMILCFYFTPSYQTETLLPVKREPFQSSLLILAHDYYESWLETLAMTQAWLIEFSCGFKELIKPDKLMFDHSVNIGSLKWHTENGPQVSEDSSLEKCLAFNSFPGVQMLVISLIFRRKELAFDKTIYWNGIRINKLIISIYTLTKSLPESVTFFSF